MRWATGQVSRHWTSQVSNAQIERQIEELTFQLKAATTGRKDYMELTNLLNRIKFLQARLKAEEVN